MGGAPRRERNHARDGAPRPPGGGATRGVRGRDHHDRLPADPHIDRGRGKDVPTHGGDGALRAGGLARTGTDPGPGARLAPAAPGGRRHEETWVVRDAAEGLRAGARLGLRRRRDRRGDGRGAVCRLASASTPSLGAEFIPRLDEGAIALAGVAAPFGVGGGGGRQSGCWSVCCMREFPRKVDTVVSKTGRPEIATDPDGRGDERRLRDAEAARGVAVPPARRS